MKLNKLGSIIEQGIVTGIVILPKDYPIDEAQEYIKQERALNPDKKIIVIPDSISEVNRILSPPNKEI